MYVNSQLAKVEAIKAGYDEAILLSPQGYVSECTGENIFVVRDGTIITPPIAAGALEGITQDAIMTIATDLGIPARTGNILRSDLYLAEEAFLSGTAAEVVPIRSVDDRELGDPGPITKAVQEVFFRAVRGEEDRYKDWNELVPVSTKVDRGPRYEAAVAAAGRDLRHHAARRRAVRGDLRHRRRQAESGRCARRPRCRLDRGRLARPRSPSNRRASWASTTESAPSKWAKTPTSPSPTAISSTT